MGDRLMGASMVARKLGVDRRTVARWVRDGAVSGVTVTNPRTGRVQHYVHRSAYLALASPKEKAPTTRDE